jgi:hypothetical protein
MRFWIVIFVIVHVAELAGLALCLSQYRFVDAGLLADVVASGAHDAISLASQLGRLDLLTIVLGVLALLLTVGTILVGWSFSATVENRAKNELRELLPGLLAEQLSASLPNDLRQLFARDPGIIVDAMQENREIIEAVLDGNSDFTTEVRENIDR